jgi:tetratricopeptide (TPR) repeat protein
MEQGLAQLQMALDHGNEVLGSNSATVGFLSENIARYQRSMGRIHLAIRNLDRALEIHGNNVQRDSFTYLSPLSARGIAKLAARQPQAAFQDLDAAFAGLNKLFGAAHEETVIAAWNRALALAYLGRAEESRAAFELPLGAYRGRYRDPLYVPNRALIAAATARRLAGDAQGARELAAEAERSFAADQQPDRQFIPLYNEYGYAELLSNHPRQARVQFARARALFKDPNQASNPVQAEVLLGLGRAHLALGERREARESLMIAHAFWRGFDAGNRWAIETAAALAQVR